MGEFRIVATPEGCIEWEGAWENLLEWWKCSISWSGLWLHRYMYKNINDNTCLIEYESTRGVCCYYPPIPVIQAQISILCSGSCLDAWYCMDMWLREQWRKTLHADMLSDSQHPHSHCPLSTPAVLRYSSEPGTPAMPVHNQHTQKSIRILRLWAEVPHMTYKKPYIVAYHGCTLPLFSWDIISEILLFHCNVISRFNIRKKIHI